MAVDGLGELGIAVTEDLLDGTPERSSSVAVVWRRSDIPATSSAAHVAPAPDDAGPAERAAENAFQVHVPAKHRLAGPGEDEREGPTDGNATQGSSNVGGYAFSWSFQHNPP